jgi:hypothetical protein
VQDDWWIRQQAPVPGLGEANRRFEGYNANLGAD